MAHFSIGFKLMSPALSPKWKPCIFLNHACTAKTRPVFRYALLALVISARKMVLCLLTTTNALAANIAPGLVRMAHVNSMNSAKLLPNVPYAWIESIAKPCRKAKRSLRAFSPALLVRVFLEISMILNQRQAKQLKSTLATS